MSAASCILGYVCYRIVSMSSSRLLTLAYCIQGLPEFPPAEGESRPMTFRKVLLNTCQEEFEGAQEAREVIP